MTFASFEFLAFFVLVLAARGLCRARSYDNWLLLAASYAFYASWSVPSVLLIMGISFVDFYVGRNWPSWSRHGRGSYGWSRASVQSRPARFLQVHELPGGQRRMGARLFGFDTAGWRFDIILPVGISFFTFKSLKPHAGCVQAVHPAVPEPPRLPALRRILSASARRPDCPCVRPAAAACDAHPGFRAGY